MGRAVQVFGKRICSPLVRILRYHSCRRPQVSPFLPSGWCAALLEPQGKPHATSTPGSRSPSLRPPRFRLLRSGRALGGGLCPPAVGRGVRGAAACGSIYGVGRGLHRSGGHPGTGRWHRAVRGHPGLHRRRAAVDRDRPGLCVLPLGDLPGSAQLRRCVHAVHLHDLPGDGARRSGQQRLGPHGDQRGGPRRAALVLHLGVRRHQLHLGLRDQRVALCGPRGRLQRPLPGDRGGSRGLGRLQLLPGGLRRGLRSPRPR